jgi:hypothetical protein
LDEIKVEQKVSGETWKMKFELPWGVKVACELLRVDDHTICVEFSRLSGDSLEFYKYYKEIAQRLSIYNDAVNKQS